jgi:hypothetical protein
MQHWQTDRWRAKNSCCIPLRRGSRIFPEREARVIFSCLSLPFQLFHIFLDTSLLPLHLEAKTRGVSTKLHPVQTAHKKIPNSFKRRPLFTHSSRINNHRPCRKNLEAEALLATTAKETITTRREEPTVAPATRIIVSSHGSLAFPPSYHIRSLPFSHPPFFFSFYRFQHRWIVLLSERQWKYLPQFGKWKLQLHRSQQVK